MSHKAGIYVRISQDRIGAGLGVERQEQDCRDLAGRIGWDVLDVYPDNDVSAYSGKTRPQYERLLADIEAGHLDAVLAWHSDRLHRSPVELERYIAVCDPRGVPTNTVKAGVLDLTTATGRMTARITGAVARHESEQKGERVRRQKQQAAAEGRWLGGRRPFGFEPDAVTPRPTEAEAIADATRRILAGDSVRSIVAEWNTAGLTTTTGAEWTGSKARQMLMRPRNAGLAGNAGRIIGPATWPAIVQPDTWAALVALLGDGARLTHRGTSRWLVGSFLFRCECGELVRSGGQRGDGQGRYACPTMHMRRAAAPIDDLVFRVICGVLVRDGMQLVTPTPDLTHLRDRLVTLRVRSEEIASLFGDPDSDMTAAQFRIANARLQQEIHSTEAELGRRTAGSTLAGIADATDPAAAFRQADIDRQRAVIDVLATVTLKRIGAGRRPGGGYFDPDSVVITSKGTADE